MKARIAGLIILAVMAVEQPYCQVSSTSREPSPLESPVGPTMDAHLVSVTPTPLSGVVPRFVTVYA